MLVMLTKTAGINRVTETNYAHLSSGKVMTKKYPSDLVLHATHGMSPHVKKEVNLLHLLSSMKTTKILNSVTTHRCGAPIIEV